MRTLRCSNSNCGRNQPAGKFCLDCGSPIVEHISVGVKFKPMETNKSADTAKMDIRRWLNRIGVKNPDIQILAQGEHAVVEYMLLGQRYTLKSHLQRNLRSNLAAVEQLLHYRVLGIERGIETREQAFAAYTALPPPKPETRSDYENLSEAELRKLLMLYHPDTGGETADPVKFQKVNDALRLLRQEN